LTAKFFCAILSAPLDEGSEIERKVRAAVGEFIRVEVFILYAIIKTGGKQYKVAEGSEIIVEKLEAEEGSSVTFEEVLAVGEGEEIKFGRPIVEGAKVTGSVVKVGKGPKIRIFKYRHKTNYRRRQGHRQPFTKVKIEKIEA
jgi:large subunit ribosomal protein L21